MAFALAHTTQGATGGATSLAITVPATTINNLVVINMKFNGAVSNISVTDNASTPNKYYMASPGGSSTIICYQFYGVQITGGATTITISWTTSQAARITVDEFSGGVADNATVLYKAAVANGNSQSASVTAITIPATGFLVSAGVGLTSASGIAAGSGYTLATTQTNQSTEYKLSGALSETGPLTWTSAASLWGECVGVYAPSGSPQYHGSFFTVM
jgi:hypothetical protein